jgi:hypothetical protein
MAKTTSMLDVTVPVVSQTVSQTPQTPTEPDPTMVVAKTVDGSWTATLMGYITPRDIAMGQRALLLAFRNRVFQVRLEQAQAKAQAEASAQETKNG